MTDYIVVYTELTNLHLLKQIRVKIAYVVNKKFNTKKIKQTINNTKAIVTTQSLT